MWRPVVVCVLTMLAPAAAAQAFECVDARGVRQYAQFCPPGTVQQREVVKEGGTGGTTANPGGAAGAAPKTTDMQEVEFRKHMLERQDAETKAAQEKAQAEEFERNCVEARTELQLVLEGRPMERFDPVTGERVRFSDAERADEAELQRKAVAKWCK